MKTQEVPIPLRPFYQHFRTLEYRHDYSIVFDDFLSAMMNYFTPPGVEGYSTDRFSRYTKEERLIFGNLIQTTIRIFEKEITETVKWFDPFGDFYQLLASRGKQSALGQFFTPSSVVDMVTQIQGSDNKLTGKSLRISDPTCGSGRMLISFHAHHPGNFCYGEDLDDMCCKMTCLNMMVHGCQGEVVNHNSLNPNDYIKGWTINGTIQQTGLPSITPLLKEKSFIYQMWQNQLSETEKQKLSKIENDKNIQIETVGLQLGIF